MPMSSLPPRAAAWASASCGAPATPTVLSTDKAFPASRKLRLWTSVRRPLFLSLILVSSNDTAEADMAGRRVDRLSMARGGPIPPAIVGSAKMRAAFQHLARNADAVARVMALLLRTAARILRHAAGLGRIRGMSRGIPV